MFQLLIDFVFMYWTVQKEEVTYCWEIAKEVKICSTFWKWVSRAVKSAKKGSWKKWHFRRGGGKQEKWIPILAQCLKTALKSLIFSSTVKWKIEWFSNSALLRHLLGVWNMAQVFFGEINSIMGQVFFFLFWYLDFENVVSRSEDCKKFWKIN